MSIPNNWTLMSLDDVISEMQTGFARSPNIKAIGIPHLRPNNISPEGSIDLSRIKYIDQTISNIKKYYVRKGDIIFNNTNSIDLVGKVAYFNLDGDYTISNHLTRIQVNKNLMSSEFLTFYLYYIWINGIVQRWAKQWVNQAAIESNSLKQLKVPVPPLNEQHYIVSILRQVNELRHLRNQSINKIKQLLDSLFFDMFGNPVINRKEWVMVTPKDIAADFKNAIAIGPFGSNLMTKDYRTKGVPLIFVKNIRENKFFGNDTKYIGEFKAKELISHQIIPGDLLMTKMGDPPGDVAIYPENAQIGIITADCIKLTLDPSKINRIYLHRVLNTDFVRSQILNKAKGVAQQKINLSSFKSLRFPLPPLELQENFAQKVSRIQAINEQQRNSLRMINDLFKSIISLAFNGELSAKWRGEKFPDRESEEALRNCILSVTQLFKEMKQCRGAAFISDDLQLGLATTLEPIIRLRKLHNSTITSGFLSRSNLLLKLFTDDSLKQEELRLRFESLLSNIPNASHHRYALIKELSDRQYELYLATLMISEEYFTPSMLAENYNFPLSFVRQGLELLATFGLVINVTLPYMPNGKTTFYIPFYRSRRFAAYDKSLDNLINNMEVIL
jgi:type I restriction enzyme S subunit